MMKFVYTILCFLVAFTLQSQTFTWTTSMGIPDSGPETCQTQPVSGLPASIDCSTFGLEQVCVRINHTWDSDLDIFLVAPDATRVELSTDNGGSGNDYGSGSNPTCFSMSAGTNVTAGTAPFTSGPYVPEGDLGTVNNGQNPNGNWQICITDDAGGDTGTLLGWRLIFGATPAPCPPPTAQDCSSGTTVCNDQAFSGNSSGEGTEELTAANRGCFSSSGEHNSAWYFFECSSAGSLEFTISPQNGTDDYDFAVWGPYASGSTPGSICPPTASPIRCSWAAGGGNTGLSNGSGDNSEGAGGDKWVEDINASVGDVYILMVDNFTAAGSPFNLNWNLSGGASLDCTPLPIELISFTGEGFSNYNYLKWTTAQEINNDYFVVMRSNDGITYEEIGFVDGAGNSSQTNNYEFIDNDFENEVSYYRLKQVDYDGKSSYSNTISIHSTSSNIVSFFPNPATNVLNINIDNKINETLTIKYVNVLGSNTIIEKINVLQGMHTYTSNKFNELINGIYFVSVLDENNNVVKVDRIVKQ